MAKKHQLNMPWIHFHVREALDELRELEALLEYLETGKKPKGMFRTDVDRFCKEGKPDESAIEIHLAASLAHAYHHMNFGWNSRRCVDTRRATDAFSKNENFPRPSEAAGWTFDRFWSKRCLICLAKRQVKGGKRTAHKSPTTSMKRGKMNAAAFLAAQVAIHARIQTRAIELGYDRAKVEPIYDGVVDAAGYLAAKPQVMWILKEPYDDFDVEGMPTGGGWTMFQDAAPGKTLAQSVNANAALRNVAYASAAILNGVTSYSELPWITDRPDMYENALRRVAYCNVGKMPGRTTTSTARLQKIAGEWKNLLFQQIDLYDPEVIIVCGTDTLQALASDMGLKLAKPLRTVQRGGAVVDVHEWRGKRLLWAPHPAARIPPGKWVDAVIAAAGGGA